MSDPKKPTSPDQEMVLANIPPAPGGQASDTTPHAVPLPTEPVEPTDELAAEEAAAAESSAVTGFSWIDEGMYGQGTRLPKSEDWDEDDWIEIPHEHYIPISKSRIIDALKTFPKAQQSGPMFEHFLEMVEGIYHFHYHKTLNELKEDYEYFAPETGDSMRAGRDEEELLWRERRFIANFINTMSRGNFNPFTDKDFQQAIQHDYLFDLPVDINFDVHDQRMLKDFIDHVDSGAGKDAADRLELEEPLEEYLNLPDDFGTNILVFHRGIERDQTEGSFVMQKVDIILSNTIGKITAPIQWLIEKLRGDKNTTDPTALLTMVTGANEEKKDENDGGEEDRSVIFERRWLRRRNLGNQQIKLKELTKKLTLQEPTLERVICLFRMRPPQPPSFVDKFKFAKRIFERFFKKGETPEKDWTINIKMFKHIPLADMEMIFPEKRVKMKSFDITMLCLTGLGGIFALYKGLKSGGKGAVVALSVLGIYTMKVLMGHRRMRANYMARITRDLYHKNLDNNIGVLQYLVDTLEEQEFKEAVLVYFMLWNEGRAMDEEEIDGKCEMFLKEHFNGIEIDFEVDDALDKVLISEGPKPRKHLPIVEALEDPNGGPTLYRALPIEEALRAMDEKWDNFYEYNV